MGLCILKGFWFAMVFDLCCVSEVFHSVQFVVCWVCGCLGLFVVSSVCYVLEGVGFARCLRFWGL